MAMTLDDDQTAALLEALGLPVDTSDPDLVVATTKDLAAQAAGIDSEKPSTIAAAARKAGLEVIDRDTAEALRRDAGEGRRMAAEAARAKVEQQVDDAVRRGKIAASRRKHWVNLIGADPGMADVLASVPDETAVPLSEAGHGQNPDPGAELVEAADWFH